MGFKLPPSNHFAREHLDMADIAKILHPDNVLKLPTFRQALRQGRDFLKTAPIAKSVTIVCLRANDDRALIQVNRRSWVEIWNFGNGR